MADNTDNDQLNKPVNTQSDNCTNDVAPTNSSETVTPKQANENMEVHHPHHITHKKKWTEYLLEFFMLFLAVFLGFVAENIRETLAEKHREKEYVYSMIEDLKIDTAKMRTVLTSLSKQMNGTDSLITAWYSKPDSDSALRYMYYLYRRYTGSNVRMAFTMRTIDQLKNAGGMYLIRNKMASDSIVEYYDHVERANNQYTSFRDKYLYEALQTSYSIFDWSYFRNIATSTEASQILSSPGKFALLHATEQEQNKYIAQLQVTLAVLKNYRIMLSDQHQRSNRLISLLQKEYHLDEE